MELISLTESYPMDTSGGYLHRMRCGLTPVGRAVV